MPTEDTLKAALEHYLEQERKLQEELESVRLTVRRIERDMGIQSHESENAQGAVALLPVGEATATLPTIAGKPGIRPDEFFGLTHAEAARCYLKKVGHAVSLDDLVTALQKGGCKVGSGGTEPKKVLYISLIRNTRDFVPPQSGYIGLREFYAGRIPAVRLNRAGRRGKPRKTKARAARAVKAPKPPVPKKSNELSIAVRDLMKDGQPRSAPDIAKQAGTKLGKDVETIQVVGLLNKKGVFEKLEGKKYRLLK